MPAHWITDPKEKAEFDRKYGKLGTTLILGGSAPAGSGTQSSQGSQPGTEDSGRGQIPAFQSPSGSGDYSWLTPQQKQDMISARNLLQNGGRELEGMSLDELASLLVVASGERTLLNPTETDLEWLDYLYS